MAADVEPALVGPFPLEAQLSLATRIPRRALAPSRLVEQHLEQQLCAPGFEPIAGARGRDETGEGVERLFRWEITDALEGGSCEEVPNSTVVQLARARRMGVVPPRDSLGQVPQRPLQTSFQTNQLAVIFATSAARSSFATTMPSPTPKRRNCLMTTSPPSFLPSSWRSLSTELPGVVTLS